MSTLKKVLILPILVFAANNAIADSKKDNIRTFGDYAQILNPIIASGLASKEKGFGHFAIIYGQNLAAVHGTKYIADQNQWSASKRPNPRNKKERYDGMPSGHTNSAWTAAAYIRTFHEDQPYLSIPFYMTAAITGYSRVHAKEHTISQVIAGAAIAEIITYINSNLDWSKNYQPTNFYIGKDQVSASFEFRF
jgi:hypothetical protein